ncbi:MAG: PBP1A family penicillin-binding protein [Armatimonadetes bacterium]|nr:PBP1A family penicillin-binding protein [Armatimonadota bacterium]
MRKLVFRYILVFFVIILFFCGIGIGLFYYYSNELPPLSELQHYDLKVGSEVYDKNDKLIHQFSVERRKLTNLSELPPCLINGVLAIEDKKFYHHWGMDLTGFLRALLKNIRKLDLSEGASTITQQLARNMFLSLDKTIPRKIKEALLAIRIEKHYSKDEILELYLNKVPFGPGLYGIEMASAKYFNKEAKELTIPQAALIIGMPQLPSAYYPFRYPERAMRRRQIVLRSMLNNKVITQQEYEVAKQDSMLLYRLKEKRSTSDYFIEYIRPKLERKYGTNMLFTGGLKIYTTMDSELQTYADSILNLNLTKFENKNDYEVKYSDFPKDTIDIETKYIQGGVFSIEPETGYVRVLIGGRNFNHSKLNRMIQSQRQPGSSFKPILYTTALVNGYTPATIIQDQSISFIQNDTLFYRSRNYSLKNFGYTRLRDGLKKSRNVVAIKTIYDLGPRKVLQFARRFGITTPLYPVYTLAIGSVEVYPSELISAYTTFPNEGERVKPIFIRKIEDQQGNILESAEIEKIRVIDEKIAFLMTSMMQSVIDEGTGRGVRWQPGVGGHSSVSYKWTAAGKTGTTDDFRDAWFIGFNKKLVTGIWVGFDDNSTLRKSQSGATAALPSWPFIMKKAILLDSPLNNKGKPIIDGSKYQFEKPEGIVTVKISKETGLLPKNIFEETIDEFFIAGTQPTPLSDSLNYNFYPTFYRENEMDSLVYDLGGRPYVWPDSTEYTFSLLDTTKLDSLDYYPTLNLKEDIDSLIFYLDEDTLFCPAYVESLFVVRDSLDLKVFSYKFYPEVFRENEIDSLVYFLGGVAHLWPDSILWREKHVPDKINLWGAKIIKNKIPVIRPDSLLYGPDSLHIKIEEDSLSLDSLFFMYSDSLEVDDTILQEE